jgi:DNA-binding SARP family transcriptional activator
MTSRPLRPPRHTRRRGLLNRGGRALIGLAAALVLLALLVGVPYGLARGLGWPLPHHWPTSTQAKSTLTGPFTDRILLDTLACLCWLIWAVFAADTLRAIPDAVRDARRQTGHPRPFVLEHGDGRRAGPLRGVATVLLAAVVTGLFSLRPHPGVLPGRASVAGPEARPTVAISIQADIRTPQLVTAAPAAVTPAHVTADLATGRGTVTVQPPHDGIHDSLWRIAARCLGDGDRWPEIYRLNYGLPQPDGESLQRPSLIQPGWVLRLPAATPAGSAAPGRHDGPTPRASHRPLRGKANLPTSTQPAPPSSVSSAPTSTPAPASPTASASPAGSPSPSVSAVHATGRGGGVDLGDGALVGFGLAGAVSAALLVTRRRRRRFYVPGSGHRDDLVPVAPVVRTLHLAHVRAAAQAADLADADAEADTDPETGVAAAGVDANTATPSSRQRTAYAGNDRAGDDLHASHARRPASRDAEMPASSSGRAPRGGVPVGVAAGREVAVELEALHGLGLAGPGAPATARALIAHLLTTGTSSDEPLGNVPSVLIPADTAAALQLPEPGRLPTRLRVTGSLATALDEAETAMLRHARLSNTRTTAPTAGADALGLVVVTSVPTDTRRLQAILDAGAPAGVAAIMLGQWRPGTSLYVEADATVSATSPGAGEPLRGAHLFCLTAADTTELLGHLHAAEHTEHPMTGETGATLDLPEPGAGREGTLLKSPPGVREASSKTSSPVSSTRSHEAHTPADGISVATPLVVVDPATATSAPDRPSQRDHRSTRAPLTLGVFGPVRLTWTSPDPRAGPATVSLDITGAVSARLRELLVLLAVHPDGITRDRLADTLWPDTSAGRPFATLSKNLVRLRRSIAAATEGQVCEIVLASGDRYQLDPEVIATDFSVFSDALIARRAASSDEQRKTAYRTVVAAYRGELGEGLTAEWLETSREAVRRDAVDAATSLARLLAGTDVRAALDMLETGRAFDPYNEAIYRDIMRLQRRLGQPDAIERTLALLTTRLAELDEQPTPETLTLAHRLQSATDQPAPATSTGSRTARSTP